MRQPSDMLLYLPDIRRFYQLLRRQGAHIWQGSSGRRYQNPLRITEQNRHCYGVKVNETDIQSAQLILLTERERGWTCERSNLELYTAIPLSRANRYRESSDSPILRSAPQMANVWRMSRVSRLFRMVTYLMRRQHTAWYGINITKVNLNAWFILGTDQPVRGGTLPWHIQINNASFIVLHRVEQACTSYSLSKRQILNNG